MMTEEQFNARIDKLKAVGWSQKDAQEIAVSIGDVITTDDAGNILATLNGEEIAIDPRLIL